MALKIENETITTTQLNLNISGRRDFLLDAPTFSTSGTLRSAQLLLLYSRRKFNLITSHRYSQLHEQCWGSPALPRGSRQQISEMKIMIARVGNRSFNTRKYRTKISSELNSKTDVRSYHQPKVGHFTHHEIAGLNSL